VHDVADASGTLLLDVTAASDAYFGPQSGQFTETLVRVICLMPVPFARMTNMSRLSPPFVKTIRFASGENASSPSTRRGEETGETAKARAIWADGVDIATGHVFLGHGVKDDASTV
jgi:hypothetical protein